MTLPLWGQNDWLAIFILDLWTQTLLSDKLKWTEMDNLAAIMEGRQNTARKFSRMVDDLRIV